MEKSASFLEKIERLTSAENTGEEARALKNLIRQGRTPVLDDQSVEIPLIPVISSLPLKYIFHDMKLPLPSLKGQYKKAWGELIELGADENKLFEILSRYPSEHIDHIFKSTEHRAEKISHETLKSLKRYRALKSTIKRDNGFSGKTKAMITNELEENIQVLELIRKHFSSKATKQKLKGLGLDKKPSVAKQKQKIWMAIIVELVNYINEFCHTDSCKRCRTTHNNALRYTAILLKAFHPRTWKGPTPLIVNQIKSRHYSSL